MRSGPARDQGRRSTCVAFALSDLHASIRSKVFAPLSVEYLFYQACRLKPIFSPLSGITLDQALQAVEDEGQPAEEEWPYLMQLPADLKNYEPPTVIGPIYRRGGQRIPGAVVDKIAEEFEANRPSMLVFRSSLRLMLATAEQPVTWSSTDQILNPHAVLAVAIGETNCDRFVKVKNSWGTRWANSGYAWLSEEYINNTFIALVGMV